MKGQFHLVMGGLFLNLVRYIIASSAGASVNVRVVPLIVKTVLPKRSVALINTLSTYKVIVSLFAFRFVRVKTFVSPSPLNVSLAHSSSIIEKVLDEWLTQPLK